MDYASTALASDGVEPARKCSSRTRLAARLAIVTAVVTAAVCSVGFMALYRQHAATTAMDSLQTPFRLYDEKCKGCRAMPARADQYAGWPDDRPVDVKEKKGMANIFVVGDWGATLPSHTTFAATGWDIHAQSSVAGAMKNRGKWADPQYILNVGDNFYVEGLSPQFTQTAAHCQSPPDSDKWATMRAFSSGWQGMYGSLANKPWLSVLGNHDYGGWRMDRGWPQQIGFSFMNYNWIMPARYYSKRIWHGKFTIDYFMIDTNAFDAKDWGDEPDHNICSPHNIGGQGNCANNGGPKSIPDCKSWFWNDYAVQKNWLEQKLNASDARWKIVVTHFPCGYDTGYWKSLKTKYGLDLLVTGHRHQQELWNPSTKSNYIQSFMLQDDWDETAPACFVTGGGGGIVSQKFFYADYGQDLQWYGFFHLTIHKDWMKIELVSTDGNVMGNMTIHPHGTKAAQKDHAAARASFKTFRYTQCVGSYCGDANNPWSKVCPWGTEPMQTCAGCEPCQNACEPYCGNADNPWEKVCSWKACKDCDKCHSTPKPIPATESTEAAKPSLAPESTEAQILMKK